MLCKSEIELMAFVHHRMKSR